MTGSSMTERNSQAEPLDPLQSPQVASSRRSHRHRKQPPENIAQPQVDSWRSYRDQATNLQQIVDYTGSQDDSLTQGHGSSALSYRPAVGHHLDPSAQPFQPALFPTNTNYIQREFNPAVSLRTLNESGHKKKPAQTGSSAGRGNGKDGRGGKQYALRSKGSIHPWTPVRDVPLPSIEQQIRHSSTVPINTAPLHASHASRHITPWRATLSPTPPLVPVVTQAYLARAASPPSTLPAPKQLLVVVDLNGTLLRRSASRGYNFVLRPGVTQLIQYLFANHVVMIYTSARPENAAGMVDKLFTLAQRKQVAAVWARDKLDLTDTQYRSKVQVYKKLDKIWNDPTIQSRARHGDRWDQSNTVLIDDSHLKAAAQPHNLLKVEEFLNDRPGYSDRNTIGPMQQEALKVWTAAQVKVVEDLQAKLEQLKWTQDVSQLIREWQLAAVTTEPPVADANPKGEKETETQQAQLLTPEASEEPHSESDQSDGGADSREVDLEELTKEIDAQLVSSAERAESGKSVSPIDESEWQGILADVDRTGGATQSR